MCSPVSSGKSSRGKDSNETFQVPKEDTELKEKMKYEDKDMETFGAVAEKGTSENIKSTGIYGGKSNYDDPPEDEIPPGTLDGEEGSYEVKDKSEDKDDPSKQSDDYNPEGEKTPLNVEDVDDESLNHIDVKDGQATVKETKGEDNANGDDGKSEGKITASGEEVKMNGIKTEALTNLKIKHTGLKIVDLHKAEYQKQKDLVAATKAQAKQEGRTYIGQVHHNKFEQQKETFKATKAQAKEEGRTYIGQLHHNRFEQQKADFRIERMPSLTVGKVDSEFQVSKQASEKLGTLIGTAGDALEKATKDSKGEGDNSEQKKDIETLQGERTKIFEKIDGEKTRRDDLYKQKEEIYSANPDYQAIIQRQDELKEEYEQNVGNDDEIDRIKGEQAKVKQERLDWEKAHPDVTPINQINTELQSVNAEIKADYKETRDLTEQINALKDENKKQDEIETLKSAIETFQEIKDKLDSGEHLTVKDINMADQLMHDLKCIHLEKGEKFLSGIEGGGDLVAASFQEAVNAREYEDSDWKAAIEKINDDHGLKIKTDHIDLLKVFADHTKTGVDGSDLIASFTVKYEASIAREGFNDLKDFANSIKDLSGFAEAVKEFNDVFKEIKMDYHYTKPNQDQGVDTPQEDDTKNKTKEQAERQLEKLQTFGSY